MTIGTAIFLSSLVISITLLFNFTKDRWNWRKILIRSLLYPIGLTALVAFVFYTEQWYSKKPVAYYSLAGINISDTRDDILFKKGKPRRRVNTSIYTEEQMVSALSAAYKANDIKNANLITGYIKKNFPMQADNIQHYKKLKVAKEAVKDSAPFSRVTDPTLIESLNAEFAKQERSTPSIPEGFEIVEPELQQEQVKDDTWFYDLDDAKVKIIFVGDKIKAIQSFGTLHKAINRFDISFELMTNGLGYGSSYDYLIEKLGEPSASTASEDKLTRILSFNHYNLFFLVQKEKVISHGIYNQNLGTLDFNTISEEYYSQDKSLRDRLLILKYFSKNE